MILYNFFYGMYFPPIDPDRIHYLKDYFEYLLYLTFRKPPEGVKLYEHHKVFFLKSGEQSRPEQLDSYLSQGWTLGRIPRNNNPKSSV